jgi:hypothetical protein
MRTRNLAQLLVFFCACASAQAASFNEVKRQVYAQPLTTMPTYDPPLARAIGLALSVFRGELIDRAKATLSDTSDYRPARPKLLHTTGVCAEGTWKIDTETFATGLLSKGTEVKVMMRLSIATNSPVYVAGEKRHFTTAIKLFPTQNPDLAVQTANLFGFDQGGIPGTDRKSFFFADNGDPEAIYYTNDVLGRGFLSELGDRTFELLDAPSTFRALYPLSEVDASGALVDQPVAPRLIRIYPRMAPKSGPMPADFRTDILRYEAGELKFDIVLPEQNGVPTKVKIGTIVLGKPVVSAFCDLELHYHHAPQNRDLVRTRR